MADTQKEGQEAAIQPGGAGKYVAGAVVVLLAAIGGLSTYLFALKPMLGSPDSATLAKSTPKSLPPDIASNPTAVVFEASPVYAVREGKQPASTLLFGMTFECNNAETAALVEKYKHRFQDMLMKLHDSRTRSELDDAVLLKESIQRQALQKANDMLQRLQVDPNPEIRITNVSYHMFMVSDPLS
jgi:flagellar basal body-associated protein FliL